MNFGEVTRQLVSSFANHPNATLHLSTDVENLKRNPDGTWRITYRGRNPGTDSRAVDARHIFIGAGVPRFSFYSRAAYLRLKIAPVSWSAAHSSSTRIQRSRNGTLPARMVKPTKALPRCPCPISTQLLGWSAQAFVRPLRDVFDQLPHGGLAARSFQFPVRLNNPPDDRCWFERFRSSPVPCRRSAADSRRAARRPAPVLPSGRRRRLELCSGRPTGTNYQARCEVSCRSCWTHRSRRPSRSVAISCRSSATSRTRLSIDDSVPSRTRMDLTITPITRFSTT